MDRFRSIQISKGLLYPTLTCRTAAALRRQQAHSRARAGGGAGYGRGGAAAAGVEEGAGVGGYLFNPPQWVCLL